MINLKFCFLLVFTLLCSLNINAYEVFEINGLYYNMLPDRFLEVEVVAGEVKYSGDIVIPNTVIYKNTELAVTKIGRDAFKDCTGLTSIDLGNVTEIGDDAFYGCTNLTSIDFKNVTYIGFEAFMVCTSLTSIDFGNVKYIGDEAFSECISLTSINLKNVYKVGWLSFERCTNLTSIDFGNLVEIESCAFEYCTALTSLDFKNVTFIDQQSFEGCEGLKSINLRHVNHVGHASFEGCPNIREIRTSEMNAPVTNNAKYSKFDDEIYELATLYIPEGSINSYRNLDDWARFLNIIEYKVDENIKSLSVSCNQGGEVSFADFKVSNESKSIELNKGDKVKLTITPHEGYRLESFKVNDKEMMSELNNNSYTLTIENDTYVNVEFAKLPVMLTIRHADNGNISMQVIEGNSYYFIINAAENWKINTVTFNDVNVTSDLDQNNGYTTPPIYESSVLNVSFESENAAVTDVLSGNISVRGYNGEIIIEGSERGDIIQVYTSEGSMIASEVSNGNDMKITVGSGDVYIVKVGNRTFKLSI